MLRPFRWSRRRRTVACRKAARQARNRLAVPPSAARFRVEPLEDRTLLSSLNIDGAGALNYTATPGSTNNLTLSLAAGQYTLQDTGETIALMGAGSIGCAGN